MSVILRGVQAASIPGAERELPYDNENPRNCHICADDGRCVTCAPGYYRTAGHNWGDPLVADTCCANPCLAIY